jgi:hypothetical protein
MRNGLALCLLACLGVVWPVSAQELRDPFEFGPEEIRVPSNLKLLGVLWDADHPFAIVNDETLAVGDEIAGWRIVEIQQDSVTVERYGVRTVLTPGSRFPEESRGLPVDSR